MKALPLAIEPCTPARTDPASNGWSSQLWPETCVSTIRARSDDCTTWMRSGSP
ncbi:unannotated protein [freshwater metagenome]|uniref:Unannotated protein n=1 Tax=freshwater metagenome TaxID=449393 RepID=A0A6J6F1Z1_9ZZZZ